MMKEKKKERTYICSGASDGANDITIIEFRGNAQALLAAVQCSGVAPESSVNLIMQAYSTSPLGINCPFVILRRGFLEQLLLLVQ